MIKKVATIIYYSVVSLVGVAMFVVGALSTMPGMGEATARLFSF